jgi:MmyB-like transcription regulator ligand binding domain
VVAALARALQLTDTERDHLYRLAGLVPPAYGEISEHIAPGVRRVLGRLGDVAVAVFAADWQLIWWNRGWATLLGDPSSTPPALRNFARDSFPATGRFPNSSRLTSLIQALTTGNQRFAELWAAGTVSAHREDHKIVEHPAVEPITMDCDVIIDGDAELKIVILTAAPDTEDETKLELAFLSGASLCTLTVT